MSLSAAASSSIHSRVSEACSDPYHGLPRVAVLAASSSSPSLVSAVAGYEQIPANADDLSTAPKLTEDSLFSLWSCTKLVTVIAALQLVEQGKVGLADDASRWVPELKELKLVKGVTDDGELELVENDAVVTVEMLITHSAGFTYEYADKYKAAMEKLGLTSPYAENATRESVTKAPFINPPGKSWSYGTSNDWLGLVISAVSGLTLGEYFQQNIFAPLGIDDMTYTNPLSRISISYAPKTPGDPYTFDAGQKFTQSINWGGAGLTGSPKSYLKILRMVLRDGLAEDGGRLLQEETVKVMFENHLTNDQQLKDHAAFTKRGNDPWTHKKGEQLEGVGYGYGGTLTGEGMPSGRAKGAMTWSGYANTFWVIDRVKDVAFLVWTNHIPHSMPALFDLWEAVEPTIYAGLPPQQ
ncbi:hypothetical protein JCM21900_002515 [Sporobolomyces salmonicolor]